MRPTRRQVLAGAASAAILPRAWAGAEPLSVLLFIADDIGRGSVGAFGGHPRVTPIVDAFAETSVRFERAHVDVSVCMPSRATILTGRLPQHNGVLGFHTSPRDQPTLMTALADHRAVLMGKVEHSTPCSADHWAQRIAESELGQARDPAAFAKACRACFDEPGPFFLNVNTSDAHKPLYNPDRPIGVEPSALFSVDEVPVPPWLEDLPETRQELTFLHNSLRRLDDVFGAVLDELEASGRADSTVVVFLSDNGVALPFAKGRCYPFSTGTPLLIRVPGAPAGTTAVPAQGVDLMPTLLELLGTPRPPTDGRSLVPFLQGAAPDTDLAACQTDLLFGDRLSPSRGLFSSTHAFVVNLLEGTYRNTSQQRTFEALVQAAESDPAAARRLEQYHHPPTFELFDLEQDPGCRVNLAAEADLSGWIAAMEERMARTADPMLAALRLADQPELRQAVVRAWYGA